MVFRWSASSGSSRTVDATPQTQHGSRVEQPTGRRERLVVVSAASSRLDVTTGADGAIVQISLDRPPANAFDLEFYEELGNALEELTARSTVPGCILLGSSVERFFCGGRDIKEPSPQDEAGWLHRHQVVGDMYRRLYEFPSPVIALIDGYALGTGCVIASLCDMRIATERSQFGLPEVRAGSVGGTRNLMRLLPQGTVRRMALTAAPIDGARAFQLGFVEQIAIPSELQAAGDAMAETVVGFDPEIVRTIKRTMNDVEGMTFWDGYDEEQRRARDRAASLRSPG
jgi:enoyl-CoA hydratase